MSEESPCVKCKQIMTKEWLEANCNLNCVYWLIFNKEREAKPYE
jgi:hypothetical protein